MTDRYIDNRVQQTYRVAWRILFTILIAGFVVVVSSDGRSLWAQEPAGSPAAQADPLTLEQQQVANRFQKLEELLLRSAEIESAENPARAALLQQAAQLGKQSQLSELLVRAATRLDKKQFSQAVEDQKTSRENLKRLLDLLQSENRGERVREQRDQVRRWIEETERMLREQKSLSGRTEGGQDVQQAAGDQEKLSNKADEISKQLGGDKERTEATSKENKSDKKSADDNKAGEPKPGEEKSGAEKSGDQKSGEDASKEKSSDPAGKKDGEGADSKKGKEGSKSDESKPSDQPKKEGESKDSDNKPNDGKPSDSKPSAGKAEDGKSPSKPDSEGKDGEKKGGENKDGKKSESDKKSDSSKEPSGEQSSESKPSEPSKGQPGNAQQGKSQEGKSGEQSEQSEQPEQQQPESKDPTERARNRIERAKKKMDEAEQELKGDKRKEAVEKQREAEAELRSAIEALEEILRQLREEEIERSLASLETRLRRMLEMQIKVFEETKRLQEITGEQATRQVESRASALSLEEKKILNEGERAFLLLSEEGSSSAFPEAMQQVNTDISKIAERLSKADIGQMTVSIEQEIVSSLEEMVAALVQVQKDKKDKKEKKKQPGQQPAGEPGDQPLVDKLAELRLIRSLQARINNRTNSLSQMLENPADAIGQATEADLLSEVKGLAERQASIRQVARDIVTGADK